MVSKCMDGSTASYYYNNRGGFNGSSGGAPPPPQPGQQPGTGTVGTVTSPFQAENPNFSSSPHGGIGSSQFTPGDQSKKKRGRPRKYGPDGGSNVSLALSPMSGPSSGGLSLSEPKRGRGRPRGSGWKQQLAPLGDWMNSSAGLAFTPHVIYMGIGEDIAAKLLSFAQQRPRALCVLAATGLVSAVTIRQHNIPGGSLTFEGEFQILTLTGSYIIAESGGPRNRTGGLSVSLCGGPNDQIIGGAVGGKLIAASEIQVVACSFVYNGGAKTKTTKAEGNSKEETSSTEPESEPKPADDKPVTPVTTTPNSVNVTWPPGSRPDSGNSQPEIDLTRG